MIMMMVMVMMMMIALMMIDHCYINDGTKSSKEGVVLGLQPTQLSPVSFQQRSS
jgi:hypothetical protein